ncbi:MAG: YqgE/AlgH family protein [Gammaproteobacteria bacterium]
MSAALIWISPGNADQNLPAATDQSIKTGTLLVARRGLPDPRFHRTVVLITEHVGGFSAGFILNRPSDTRLHYVLPELESLNENKHKLHFGGPVATDELKLIQLSNDPPKDTEHLLDGLYLSGNLETLKDALTRKLPTNELRVYYGYAAWSRGQLASELVRGDWFVHGPEPGLVFSTPEDAIWSKLIDRYDPEGTLVRAPGIPWPITLMCTGSAGHYSTASK